jgi:hypothetical protein
MSGLADDTGAIVPDTGAHDAALWHPVGEPDTIAQISWILTEARRLAVSSEVPSSDQWRLYAVRKRQVLRRIEQLNGPVEPAEPSVWENDKGATEEG